MLKGCISACILGTASAAVVLTNEHKPQVLKAPDHGKAVPDYPASYTVTGVMRIPYADVNEPVTVVTDGENNRQFVSYYHGLKEIIYTDLGTNNSRTYEFFIADNERVCFHGHVSGDSAAMDEATHQPKKWPVRFLPNLEEFSYRGTTKCKPTHEMMCHQWSKESDQNGFHSEYKFLALDDEDMTPFRFVMMGRNAVIDSHYDNYIIDYESFSEHINPAVFEAPETCSESLDDRKRVHFEVREELAHLFEAEHDYLHGRFRQHLSVHGHRFEDPREYASRLSAFKRNMQIVNQLNKQSTNGVVYKANHLMHLDLEDMLDFARGYQPAALNEEEVDRYAKYVNMTYVKSNEAKLPDMVDWRLKGAVTTVKDQGTCGSCWAFSAAGALESHWFIKTGELIDLSPQQAMDCSWGLSNHGCSGGDQNSVFTYLADVGGMMSLKDYPFLNVDDFCHYKPSKVAATTTGRVNIPKGNEELLKDALATKGPIAIALDASRPSLLFYSSGVYEDPACDPENLDHAVLLVGYGTEDGKDYWLIKNSWSTFWANMGYIKIRRNLNNHCGIASAASYPAM